MCKPYIIFHNKAICRYCGGLLSEDSKNIPVCPCRLLKKIGDKK